MPVSFSVAGGIDHRLAGQKGSKILRYQGFGVENCTVEFSCPNFTEYDHFW